MRLAIKTSAFLFCGIGKNSFSMPLECPDWFQSAKVNPGLMCMLDCMTIQTQNFTSTCPIWCPDLCELNFAGVAFFKVSQIYPALTLPERALVASFPWEMTRAYAYSWKAERTCLTIYKSSTTNDESDACRHFVWAGLLANYFGAEFAAKILDAHEDNTLQALEEKSMDLANNRAGILACESLKTSQKCNNENLLDSFIKALKAKRLIVLTPQEYRFK